VTETSTSSNHPINPRVLKINVGFMLANSSGYSRVTPLHIPDRLQIASDLIVERVNGEIRLTTTSEGILVQGSLEVTKLEDCTRCLSEIEAIIDVELEELYATNHHVGTDFMVDDDGVLDLAPLLREETFLAIPTQIYCLPGMPTYPSCNYRVEDSDSAGAVMDPRWAALAKLQEQLANDDDV